MDVKLVKEIGCPCGDPWKSSHLQYSIALQPQFQKSKINFRKSKFLFRKDINFGKCKFYFRVGNFDLGNSKSYFR